MLDQQFITRGLSPQEIIVKKGKEKVPNCQGVGSTLSFSLANHASRDSTTTTVVKEET